jgi:hypothetical protein
MEFSPKLEKELLIRWIVDTLWRTLVHYGYWLKEVEYQYGMEVALEMEKEVGETSMAIQLKRIAKLLKIELCNGIPAVLYRMDEKQLVELLDTLSLNWLANDGVWFQAVEKSSGSWMQNDVMIPAGPDFLPMKPTISKPFWVCRDRVAWRLSKGRSNCVYMPASINKKLWKKNQTPLSFV